MVHLCYSPASNMLYQPSHHRVWDSFWQPPNALVTHSFTCYAYMDVTAAVPPIASHLGYASPGLAQTLHLQGCLKPLPILPAITLSDHIHGLWKEQACSIFPNQCQAIAEAVLLGTAHGVCNGLYMCEASPEFATAAWLLEDSQFPYQNLC